MFNLNINQNCFECKCSKKSKQILLFCFFFLLINSFSLYAQSVKITISLKEVSLKDFFNAIEKQSSYKFSYREADVKEKHPVTISVKDETLQKALSEVLPARNLQFKIAANKIVITAADNQKKRLKKVTGLVKDNKGEPVAGANVVEKGTINGIITDMEGQFSLETYENSVLQISFIGYQTQDIQITGKSNISVTLAEDSQTLDEVIVVGYGTQKKINLTGAVTQVSSEVIKDRQVSNIGQALQGTIANLQITTTGEPGGVGTPSKFNIRGTTSLNGGEPLYLVDGVPASSINNLNPADIESVTVLKDAASAAIYGARGAYGVILITTKKGDMNKTTVSYSGMVAVNNPTKFPKMGNSLEFAETYNAAARNSGLSDPFPEEYISRIKQYMADPTSIPVTTPDSSDPTLYGFGNANANTDWFKEYFKSGAFSHKHDLSVSGGNKTITYYMSAGYYDENGLLRHGDENYNRINVTANMHAAPLSWLRFDFRTRYSRGKTDNPYPYTNNNGNWFHFVGTRQPIWPARNPDGNFSLISNLSTFTNGARSINRSNDLWLTGAVEIEPIKNWKINVDYSFNSQNNKNIGHEGEIYAYKIDGTKYPYYVNTSIDESVLMNNYNSLNMYTSYQKQINEHFFKALVGQQIELAQFYTLSGIRKDMMVDNIPSMGVATGSQYASDAISEWATIGTFARLNYNYDEKYLIEFNARYDGTSRFPKEKRFGFFPSVSIGYNIAKENFWPLKEKIQDLKVRASYGSLGNQSVNNYLFYATVPINTQLGYLLNNKRPNYLGAPGLVSSELTWETSNTIDIGLDTQLFNNRLSFTFDWYSRKTLNMLGPAEALPTVLGASVPLTNNADLKTNGFELNIGWKDNINNKVDYHVSFILSDYVSKVTRYNNPTGLLSTYHEGQTIGEYWGYETNGLIQTEEQLKNMADQSLFYGTWNLGDVEYKDQNGDHIINYGKNTIDDHGDMKVIGNSTPRFSFGLNAGLNWKGFDLSMFFQGVAKRDIWMGGTYFYGLLGGYGSAVWKSTLDYWTENNKNAYWPKPYHTGEIDKNRQITNQYMQNAAYIRLKNLQIGYSIPPQILRKCNIQRLRIFLTGENLFTISSINENFDPEVDNGNFGSGKIYPLMRTFSCGLNLEF